MCVGEWLSLISCFWQLLVDSCYLAARDGQLLLSSVLRTAIGAGQLMVDSFLMGSFWCEQLLVGICWSAFGGGQLLVGSC